MFTSGETVSLAEWIIDDIQSCLHFVYLMDNMCEI